MRRGIPNRTRLRLAMVSATVAVTVLTSVGWDAAGASAVTSPTPSPTPTPSATTPAPAPDATTTAPTPTPTPSDPISGTEDPSLQVMNDARNHSMGSTVKTNEPTTTRVRSFAAAAAGFPPGVPGLDVSGWQVLTRSDWSTIAANGAKFAYVKATESTDYRSSQFSEQYTDSYAAGLIRGAYHFATPNTSSGATQANYFVNNGGGWAPDGRTLPPLLDIEYNPYGDTCYGMTASAMVSWIRDFSNTVFARVGRYPAIYSTTDWWTRCTGNNAGFGNHPLFIARYPSSLSSGAGTLPAGWANYTMWQYADSGVFPGDQDTFNGSVADLLAFASNGPNVQPLTSPIIGTGDFNGDGKPDFIARRSDGTLWFYAGTGSATSYNNPGYLPAVQIGTGWGVYNALAGVGDISGDGIPDLVARRPDGTVYVYTGTGKAGIGGNEGYTAAQQVASGWQNYTDITAVGDFSGDGKADLLARKADGSLWLIASTGRVANGSTFAAPVQIGTNWTVFQTLLGIGDLNRDGRPDLVGIAPDGSATFYAGAGASAGYYRAGTPIALPGIRTTDVFATVGDFDGDGRPDLLDRTLAGDLYLIRGTAIEQEGYRSAQSGGGLWTQVAQLNAVGDFNGDSKPDILTSASDGTLWFRGGTGTSNPSFGAATKVGWGWNIFSRVVSSGDLNGDGKPDLLGIKPDGTLWFYAGTGSVSSTESGYKAGIQVGWGWNTLSAVQGVGDLNGDGKSDLIAVRSDGALIFYAGTGVIDSTHQGYQPGVVLNVGAAGAQELIAPRDFTGDNKADLIVRKTDGTLWLYPGTGSQTAAAVLGTPYRIGTGWSVFQTVVAPGDLNGDGKSDLFAITSSGSASFYAGTGTAGAPTPAFATPMQNGSNWGSYR